MRKNTIQSISEQTGYSVSTVSRVLSGKAQRSRISQKAIEIIQAEAMQGAVLRGSGSARMWLCGTNGNCSLTILT